MNKPEGRSVSKRVIVKIQDMIINGDIKEGDKLPPERELTEKLDVGRPALREALKALEVLGLVEARHGSGNYIVNHVNESYFKPLSISFKLSEGTAKEIFEMRNCLETYSVRSAAKKATPTDILSLRNLLAQMEEAESPLQKASLDRAMHFEIARIADNSLIYNTMESISFLMDSFIERTVQLSYFEGDSIENIYQEHLEIIQALEKHDAEGAVETLTRHLQMIDLKKI